MIYKIIFIFFPLFAYGFDIQMVDETKEGKIKAKEVYKTDKDSNFILAKNGKKIFKPIVNIVKPTKTVVKAVVTIKKPTIKIVKVDD